MHWHLALYYKYLDFCIKLSVIKIKLDCNYVQFIIKWHVPAMYLSQLLSLNVHSIVNRDLALCISAKEVLNPLLFISLSVC